MCVEIDKVGVIMVVELVVCLSVSVNNLIDGGSVVYGGFCD